MMMHSDSVPQQATIAQLQPGKVEPASYHVLIVDDDAGIREGLVSYLQNYHEAAYHLVVDSAPHTKAAKEKIERKQIEHPQTERPYYDLVITDINMPDGDGFSLIKYIKAVSPSTKMALITAYQVEEYVRNAKHTGVCNIIAKSAPFNFKELSQVVNNLLEPQSAFGLATYMEPGCSLTHILIRSSDDIMVAFGQLQTFLNENQVSNSNDLLTVLLEAVTNAVYHVNTLPDGSLKYTKGQVIEQLEANEQVEILFGRDSQSIGISITDQGGRMTAEQVLYWMDRNISGSGLLDTHGRGMYLMHQLTDRLLINIAPGERTEIILLDYLGAMRSNNKPIYINQF